MVASVGVPTSHDLVFFWFALGIIAFSVTDEYGTDGWFPVGSHWLSDGLSHNLSPARKGQDSRILLEQWQAGHPSTVAQFDLRLQAERWAGWAGSS